MKKKENIKRYTLKQLKKLKGKSDWKRVASMTEEELEAAIASDPDSNFDTTGQPVYSSLHDVPGLNWEKFMPDKKRKVSLRIDEEILDWFQKHGKGYQTRMNAVLRAYVESQKH